MHIFYLPEINSDICNLGGEESRHCIKVLRLRPDDEIHIIDGKGGYYFARILTADHKSCQVKITGSKTDYGKRDYYLHIAISPTKNHDRLEWFVEKATEIGIDEITPLITEHSERNAIKIERLNKIIISASKQAINPYFPVVNKSSMFHDIINLKFNGLKFLASYSDVNLKDAYSPGMNALILIGPEGDFTDKEIKNAEEQGFVKASLGKSRLRTETAGVVACHTINLLNLR